MTKSNTLTCSRDLITNSENTNPEFSQNFKHLDCFCLVSLKKHQKTKTRFVKLIGQKNRENSDSEFWN